MKNWFNKPLLAWRSSIRARLITYSVLFAMLPVLAVHLIASAQTVSTLHGQIGANVRELASSTSADVERFLSSRRGDIQVLAQSPALTSSTDSPADKARYLKSVQQAYGIYDSLYVVDAEGTIVASTDQTIGDQSGQTWFSSAMTGSVFVSDVYFLTSAQGLVVTISAPIARPDGQLMGVVAGNIAAQRLFDVAGAVHVGQQGEVFLVNREGRISVSKRADLVFTDVSTLTAVQSALLGQGGTVIDVDYDTGQPALYAFAPSSSDQDWIAIGKLPLTELDAPIAELARQVIPIELITIALVIVAVALVTRAIVRPIKQLTGTAQQLSSGDFSVDIPSTGPDEIGQLADSFRSMSGELQTSFKNLEASREEALRAGHVAREANRLKSEFLATISHELRTPLNAMIGFTEIMMSGMGGVIDQDANHMVERIHANSQRLLGLINDVLDLSKIEAKRVEVKTRPFSPARLAADLQTQMQSLASKRGLSFHINIDPMLPSSLVGDDALIGRVVTNLLSNAFKFTEKGGVNVTLATLDDAWAIEVEDTGIGIPPHAQEFIFDPFRQVDGSTQRAFGGTGLGLAIVRELVRLMEGSVRVESVVGRGSKFTVTLPLVSQNQMVEPHLEASPA